MYAVYFLARQVTASPNAPHSSQILEELNFSLFLSSNFKMNGQFGFGQRNHPYLTVSYPLHFVLESFSMVVHLDIFLVSHSVNIKRYLDHFRGFDIFSSTFSTDFMSLQIHHHSDIIITITRVATGITY